MTKNELKTKLNTLLEYFIQHTDDVNTQKDLTRRITNLDGRRYKVAVVANMSAGKSTFINALLGEDILPTSTKATTDCATYIYPREGKKEAKIYFSDDANKAPETLGEDRLKELREYAKKDEDCENPKHKNVEQIDLYYPFKLLSESSENMDFEIVFIDNPGPNSTGGDYAEKHKNATIGILNEVNLALYLLDYSQLDSLFSNDKQGLWKTIEKRKKEDEHFEIFFIINKIDFALDNLETEINDIKDDDEYNEAKMKKWGKYEQEAIQKVASQVKEHFELEDHKIKVFAISSQNQILRSRQQKLVRTEKEKYEMFRKWFDGFANKEKAMIDYIGFESLENEIQHFLQQDAQKSIITPLLNEIKNTINQEGQDINKNLKLLEQPQKEAEENLKKGKQYLEQGCKILQENMAKDIESIQEKAKGEINALFDKMKADCEKSIEDCVVRAMIFLLAYTEGYSIETAKEDSMREEQKEAIKEELQKQDNISQKFPLRDSINADETYNQLGSYINEMLNDMRRDLLDMQSDVRLIYDDFNRSFNIDFERYKAKIRKELNQNLGVECSDIPIHDTHIDLPCDMDFLSGNVNFIHKEAEYRTIDKSRWYKPWTWIGDWTERVKVSNEENYMYIDPKKLQEDIETQILQTLDNITKQAKEQHAKNIKSQSLTTSALLREFIEKQNEDIKELEKNSADIAKGKQIYEARYRAFQDMCEKIDMKAEGK